MPKPLMALVNPPNHPWSHFSNEGLQLVEDFKDRLYKDKVDSSGVPSLFAHPIVFSKNLEENKYSAFEKFSTLVKGIFLDVIKPEVIGEKELGKSLRAVVQGFQPGMDDFVILKWNGKAIGGIYPESLVFPGVRITDDDLKKIELENDAKEQKFGSATVKFHFKQWVIEITGGVADGNNRPLWANKLFQMTNKGGPWEVTNINTGRPLEGCRLPLIKVKVLQNKNSDALCKISLVHYLEVAVVCHKNDNKVKDIVLSDMNIGENLILGDGKRIKCLKEDGKLICEVCNIKGVGPEIEEVGFFEQRNEYIIWKDFEKASLPTGCTDIEYIEYTEAEKKENEEKKDHAILTFGKLKIKINGTVISKEDILCEKVYKFNNDVMPFLPVKSEYLDCIDLNGINLKGSTPYDITLKGKIHVKHTPKVEAGDMASILLFPSFNDQSWKINYAFFFTSAKLIDKATIALFSVNEEGVKPLSKEIVIEHKGGIKTDLPVTHVEVLIDKEQVGIFKDPRPDAVGIVPGASKRLSLDFGTSNTMLAVETIGSGNTAVHNPLLLKDQSRDILENDEVDKDKIREWWLPNYMPDVNDCLSSSPSEIIFVSPAAKYPAFLDQPILKYTNPHSYHHLRIADYECIVGNFKWDCPEPFNGYEDSKKLRSSYLKMIMHMALAEERDKGCGNVSLTVTYPLAFGKEKYERYKDIFRGKNPDRGLIKDLQDETGMTIAPGGDADWNNVEFIPEAFACKARFAVEGGGYQFVVDIGGGTTDLALSIGDNKIIAYDSIRYGGNNYVDLLADDDQPARLLLRDGNDGNVKLNKISRIIILNKEIRQGNFGDFILGQLENVNKDRKSYILEKLHFFYETLFCYMKLLLDGNGITDNITIYPVGNAWKFIDAFQDVKGVSDYIERYFKEHGINIVVNPAAVVEGKKSVATGALIVSGGKSPSLTDPVKSVAGCDNITIGGNTIIKDFKIPYSLKLKNHDQKSLPGVSTAGFINSLDWRPKEGVKTIEIIQEFNKEIQNSLDFGRGKWRLTNSLFGIFMEKIVVKYYL